VVPEDLPHQIPGPADEDPERHPSDPLTDGTYSPAICVTTKRGPDPDLDINHLGEATKPRREDGYAPTGSPG